MATPAKQLMDLIDGEPLTIAAPGRHSGLSAEQKHGLYVLWREDAEAKINEWLETHTIILRPAEDLAKYLPDEPEDIVFEVPKECEPKTWHEVNFTSPKEARDGNL